MATWLTLRSTPENQILKRFLGLEEMWWGHCFRKQEFLLTMDIHIFFRNYFTSLRLLQHLSENNICATGTVRQDRAEKYPFSDIKFWKDKPRGTCYFMSCENVTFVQWKDNKVVTVATNFESNDVTTSRWCKDSKTKKQITQSKIIANYNKNMGGVDIMDGLIAVYRTRMRQMVLANSVVFVRCQCVKCLDSDEKTETKWS